MDILRTNKIRAGLTLIGVVIGIGAIITTLTIRQGMRLGLEDLAGFNRNTISIYRERDPVSGRWPPMFDLEDARHTSRIQGIKKIALSRGGIVDVRHGRRSGEFFLQAVTAEYADLRNLELESGRFITHYDVRDGHKVCIITDKVEAELFPNKVYLGKKIEINRRIFEVVGKVKSSRSSSVFGQTLNRDENHIFIPITATNQMNGSRHFDRILLEYSPDLRWEIYNAPITMVRKALRFFRFTSTEETSEVKEIVSRIESILLLQKGAGHRYAIITPKHYVKDIGRTLRVATVVLGGVAALSLLLGGIGIMNIMTDSVRERSQEIGIRKAIGARKGNIFGQFLAETLFLSLTGGIGGIVLGFFSSQITDAFWGIPTAFPWWSALIGLAFASLVGLIFGIYPAYRAATLNPTKALRHE